MCVISVTDTTVVSVARLGLYMTMLSRQIYSMLKHGCMTIWFQAGSKPAAHTRLFSSQALYEEEVKLTKKVHVCLTACLINKAHSALQVSTFETSQQCHLRMRRRFRETRDESGRVTCW